MVMGGAAPFERGPSGGPSNRASPPETCTTIAAVRTALISRCVATSASLCTADPAEEAMSAIKASGTGAGGWGAGRPPTLREVAEGSPGIPPPGADPAEGVAEEQREYDRHEEQKEKGLPLSHQLPQVFEGDIENADHASLSGIPPAETPDADAQERGAPAQEAQQGGPERGEGGSVHGHGHRPDGPPLGDEKGDGIAQGGGGGRTPDEDADHADHPRDREHAAEHRAGLPGALQEGVEEDPERRGCNDGG